MALGTGVRPLAGMPVRCYHDVSYGVCVIKEVSVIRTQVQLSESQMQHLKELARQRGVSVAALIREGADLVIRSSDIADQGQRKRRAVAAAGRFHSGHRDLAGAHDRHLAEVLGE
jgi:hypothetical protein